MTQGVLVVGATGTQGGAVVDQLLAAPVPYDVTALTRDPDAEAASNLQARGVTVAEGDLREPETLLDAMADVDAVFGMTDYWDGGSETERTQGRNLIRAAVRAGVDHVVYSSAVGAGTPGQPPMLATKADIEATLRASGLSATVVRPAYLVQNFELRRDDITDGTVALPLAPGRPLPMVDAVDIGRVVTRVLAAPDRYRGETVPLVGIERTLSEIATVFADHLDQSVEAAHVPLHTARARAGEDYASLFEWYNDAAVTDVTGPLQTGVLEPTTLGAYLRRAGWGRPELPGEWEPACVRTTGQKY